MSILDATFFRDEEAAYSKLESVLWPYCTECPHCGVIGNAVKIKANPEKKVRHGLSGVAKRASRAATARSHAATSWHPAAVAIP